MFARARKDPLLAVIEGFHAVKHAMRFGAKFKRLVGSDRDLIEEMGSRLAPDILDALLSSIEWINESQLRHICDPIPRTRLVAISYKAVHDPQVILGDEKSGIVVFLEDPRDLGNIGAVIRVAAAASAAGVITSGHNDPWHPLVIRGAAGLHYAVPVVRLKSSSLVSRKPIVAVDPDGRDLEPGLVPSNSVLAFGTERDGLSSSILAESLVRVRIPMQPGVSSMNLATSVAVMLFCSQAPGFQAKAERKDPT